MKNLSILLVMCLLGTLSLEAQKTTVPAFKTVQVRPGVIKVPGFSLRAGTTTEPDLKTIKSFNSKVITELAPGQLLGAMEVATTTAKMNLELTPKNFLAVKEVRMYVNCPIIIYDDFMMGGNNVDFARDQSVMIYFDVTYGKQYLIRIPVIVDGPDTRSFVIKAFNNNNQINLFTTAFSGSQEIAFTVVPQNTGTILMGFSGFPPSAGTWHFTKVIITEL
jgi:hypothetical protein